MRIFSDFRVFERPPKLSPALFRWIAWRWLFLGVAIICFIAFFGFMHFVEGEPVYYTNENRNLTDAEVWDGIWLFVLGGGLFAILGLLGVFVIPKD